MAEWSDFIHSVDREMKKPGLSPSVSRTRIKKPNSIRQSNFPAEVYEFEDIMDDAIGEEYNTLSKAPFAVKTSQHRLMQATYFKGTS